MDPRVAARLVLDAFESTPGAVRLQVYQAVMQTLVMPVRRCLLSPVLTPLSVFVSTTCNVTTSFFPS